MNYGLFLLVVCLHTFFVNAYVDIIVPDSKHALDLNLFERVLDPELCNEQVTYIVNNTGLLFTCKYILNTVCLYFLKYIL